MAIKRLRDDQGFTLVEVLLAAMLSTLLGSLIISTAIVSDRSETTTAASVDLTGEARQLLNRLTSDLRQAKPVWTGNVETPAITAVQNPYPGGDPANVTSVTFDADYNGDGCIAGVSSDGCNPPPAVDANNPETETVCWNPASKTVYLIGGTVQVGTCLASTGTAQPLLAGQVSSFQISYDSNQYLYDSDANGVTTWQELDAAGSSVGNGNNILDVELPDINSLNVNITVTEGTHTLTEQAQVFVRNLP